jgi:hypothetical protein
MNFCACLGAIHYGHIQGAYKTYDEMAEWPSESISVLVVVFPALVFQYPCSWVINPGKCQAIRLKGQMI